MLCRVSRSPQLLHDAMTNLDQMPSSGYAERPDYGIDAPGVIRNLLVVGVAALALWISTMLHLWSGVYRIPVSSPDIVIGFGGFGLWRLSENIR